MPFLGGDFKIGGEMGRRLKIKRRNFKMERDRDASLGR